LNQNKFSLSYIIGKMFWIERDYVLA